jgi:membrane fusion protein, multidrug efflux system
MGELARYFGALAINARGNDAWPYERNYMNKDKMKKTIILFTLLLAACEKPAEPTPPPRPALVTIVGTSAANEGMVLVGEVKSRFESNQSFRINGKIIERKVDVGSVVKKGQVLARLDASDSNLSAAASQADVRAAEAGRALASADVERQRILVNKKFISQAALDKYEAELKTANARVNQAKAQAAVSGNQSRYNALTADRDGVVTQIHAEPGQVVEAGAMIVQIVDTKQIEVLVAVPESRMAALKVNDAVTIKLWADREKTYSGTVREVAPAANSATRAFDVRVAVKDADEAVKLGMTAGVRFSQNNIDAIMIPSSALTQINGKNSVWVIDKKGIANPREVSAGQYTEVGVKIASGLQAGEMIAIAGVHTLIKGQQVKPIIEANVGVVK